MAKLDKKIQQYRNDGLAYAVKIYKEGGEEALLHEAAIRGAAFIPMELTPERREELSAYLAERIISTVFIDACVALIDEFKFGESRLKRFKEMFMNRAKLMGDCDPFGGRYVKMSDFARELNEKYHLDIEMDNLVRIEEENEAVNVRMAKVDAVLDVLERYGHEEAAGFLREFWEVK